MVSLPVGNATAFAFDQNTVEESTGSDFWHEKTKLKPQDTKAWLVFLNPFSMNVELWLKQWNQAYPHVPIFGALAGGVPGDPEAWVFCNEGVVPGGVALALEGDIAVYSVVSQGCKPIGEPLTVTQADRNVLLTLGSRPAYEVLSDVYKDLSDAEREQARGHLFAGLAVSEYLDEYKRGDFLVRNIIGPIPKAERSRSTPCHGSDKRFSTNCAIPMRRAKSFGACCANRQPSCRPSLLPDCSAPAMAVAAGSLDGPITMRVWSVNSFRACPDGLFASGEIGPVGDRSFAHGYTASLALLAPALPPKKEI